MVDLQTVCCMCGDIGFPDKLFRCRKCDNRFQHSYCSNYYSEFAVPLEMCDWCRCEEKRSTPRHGPSGEGGSSSSKRSSSIGNHQSQNYSGDKIKQPLVMSDKGSGKSGTPSPRPATRRYKLLKDVMC